MRDRGRVVSVLMVAVCAALVVFAARVAPAASSSGPFKVAWIYVGPHNDGGWSQAHDEGRQYVQKMLGSRVQTTFKENIAVGPPFASTVQTLVADGYKLIFATSYGYITPALAAKYPQVKFEQATGSLVTKNVSEYFGAAEDTIFLSGIAAGAASKTGKLGYGVAFPTPEVIRDIDAFALGAQVGHPGATVRIVWTHSWFDPPTERRAAASLHSAGADVLGQDVDSPTTGQYAQSVGIPWVGYDSNSSSFAPKAWLTASVSNWGPYYLRRVKAAMAGTWKAGFYYGSIKDGFTSLAPYGRSVSAATKAKIASYRKKLVDGSYYEFAGPLYDQSGKLRVAKGHRLSVQQLYAIDWLVKGVIGSAKG